MVQYPGSISLRAGQIQFASPAAFVNNLGDFRVKPGPTSIIGVLSTASAGLLWSLA